MIYDDALKYMINKQGLGIIPGLSRIVELLDRMDNPQEKIKIIHIAGTNGKGTVAKTIADTLISNGHKVGLFTSPWIIDYTEQIMINNTPIDKNTFARYVDEYKDNDCSEFEYLTAIMYKYFSDEKVDYAVVECGMGGKGDATNVEKENVCSVLTSISLDHTDFLGDSIEKITAEKEGIIRNSPCFRYEPTGDFNKDNLTLARKVISYLGYDDNIQLSELPARQQYIGDVLLDGGHNKQAGIELSRIINNEIALIGMMRDKDIDGYLSSVALKCKKIYCTDVNNPRAISAKELVLYAKEYCDDVEVVSAPELALEKGNITLICGSFYMIREVIKELI